MTFRFRSGSAVVVALLALALAVSPVLAGSSTWKLSSFNSSGRALRSQTVAVDNGAASFTFPSTADAAYLLSSKAPAAGTGLSATASITTTGATTFAYYPEGTPAMVGLYFQTKSSGGFDPSDYWWSGSSRITLDSIVLNGSASMTASFGDGSQWTNFYGKPGNQVGTYEVNGITYPSAADGFAAAVANVSSWGVSFGGGSFYANGAGTPTGSAVFTLTP